MVVTELVEGEAEAGHGRLSASSGTPCCSAAKKEKKNFKMIGKKIQLNSSKIKEKKKNNGKSHAIPIKSVLGSIRHCCTGGNGITLFPQPFTYVYVSNNDKEKSHKVTKFIYV